MIDPFDALREADTPAAPRSDFAAALRQRIEAILTTGGKVMMATQVVPYLAVHDGPAALDWYARAFGAVEVVRVAMPDGRIGHAEFRIGTASFYLADEFAEIGVVSPLTLEGSPVTLHLTVTDVDGAYGAAVAAGASAQAEPADQPHGARHGTLIDPFGHRWMLSQSIEFITLPDLATRMTAMGMSVALGPAAERPAQGGIWAALNFADAVAGIRFMVDVLGFEEQLVVRGADPDVIEHSQLRWPEGGIVQAATASRGGNPFSQRPTGTESLYVITADPLMVYERCLAAGAEVLMPPMSPDYDPLGTVFSIRDPEGNIWSFGTYSG